MQAFPPLEGSVIAFLDHEEMTDKGALYDVAWSGIVNATGLDVSDVRRIDLLFVPDHTMQRSPTSAPQATTERMNLAPSPTGSTDGLSTAIYVVIALMSFLIVLVLVIGITCLVLRARKQRSGGDNGERNPVMLSDTPQMLSARNNSNYDQPGEGYGVVPMPSQREISTS